MTDPTLALLIAETRDHVYETWLAARELYPTQPPHPVTAMCAAALAHMEKACSAAADGAEVRR